MTAFTPRQRPAAGPGADPKLMVMTGPHTIVVALQRTWRSQMRTTLVGRVQQVSFSDQLSLLRQLLWAAGVLTGDVGDGQVGGRLR
jgi:hypothetical protein